MLHYYENSCIQEIDLKMVLIKFEIEALFLYMLSLCKIQLERLKECFLKKYKSIVR